MNKVFGIFCFVAGVLCFSLAIAQANGWQPMLPTAQAATQVSDFPVIAQDTPQNIEVDGELAQEINLPEMVIASSPAKINPGAARRRSKPTNTTASTTETKTSGLDFAPRWATTAALGYRPMADGHGTRAQHMRVKPGSLRAKTQEPQERQEVIIIDAK